MTFRPAPAGDELLSPQNEETTKTAKSNPQENPPETKWIPYGQVYQIPSDYLNRSFCALVEARIVGIQWWRQA